MSNWIETSESWSSAPRGYIHPQYIDPPIQQLDDTTVIDLLSNLTEKLQQQNSGADNSGIQSAEEANDAIIHLLNENNGSVEQHGDEPVVRPDNQNNCSRCYGTMKTFGRKGKS
jgi:hypothetical protein